MTRCSHMGTVLQFSIFPLEGALLLILTFQTSWCPQTLLCQIGWVCDGFAFLIMGFFFFGFWLHNKNVLYCKQVCTAFEWHNNLYCFILWPGIVWKEAHEASHKFTMLVSLKSSFPMKWFHLNELYAVIGWGWGWKLKNGTIGTCDSLCFYLMAQSYLAQKQWCYTATARCCAGSKHAGGLLRVRGQLPSYPK